MLIFNENSKFDEIVDFENRGILNYKGMLISDQEIWDIAKTFDEPPYINNIYYSEVLYSALNVYMEEYPFLEEDNFFVYINGLDTHFDYNDKKRGVSFDVITDFSNFESELEDNKTILEEIESEEYSFLTDEVDNFFKDKKISITKENYDNSLDKCYDYLSEKFKFIDIPMESIENIVKEELEINLEENKKDKNKKDKNMER